MNSPTIKLFPVKLTRQTEISEGVFVLAFQRTFEFRAGQVIAIGKKESDEARLYSIISSETQEEVEILYDVVKGGYLTPWLSQLQKGDMLFISEPFGSFEASDAKAWWIATGTGIGPYISMLRSGYGKQNTLLHGGRLEESFYFSKELKEVLGDNYICCSTKLSNSGYYRGRVSDYLMNYSELPQDILYYLCGSAEMVIDCREILLTRGIPYGNIMAEVYF